MLRFLWVLLAIVAAAILMPLGIANRQLVTLNLDPFGRPDTSLTVTTHFSLLLFVVFMLGLLIGGFAVWAGQGKWRRTARVKAREAFQWKAQADRLAREQEISQGGTPAGDSGAGRTRTARLAHGR